MTDKDLRHLSRAELLDILYEQQKRYEDSLAENQALRQQLEDRTLRIASAGSIAEAAIQVNGVFEAAPPPSSSPSSGLTGIPLRLRRSM